MREGTLDGEPGEPPRPKRAVLLLQMGGPESLDDLQPFLQNLFLDGDIIQLGRWSFLQKPLAWMVSRTRAPKMAKRYIEIGGGSPLNGHTTALARALEGELAARGSRTLVRVVNRYTPPRAERVVRELAEAEVDEVAALTLYPHYSVSTTGSSLRDLGRAHGGGGEPFALRAIDRWGDDPGYVQLLRDQLAEALARVRERTSAPVHLLASAHGTPVGYEARGDPYRKEVERTFHALTKDLDGYEAAHLGFQSKIGPVEWLRPYTDDVIPDLAAQGVEAVVALPLGFVSDHVETLYDLDVNYRRQARAAGIRVYERVPAFNADPEFVRVLADLLAAKGAIPRSHGREVVTEWTT